MSPPSNTESPSVAVAACLRPSRQPTSIFVDFALNFKCWRLRYCEDRLSGVARARVGEWKCFYMVEQRFDDVWGLRLGLIASLGEGKEARRIHLGLCSSTVFGNYGSMTKQWGGFDSDIPRVTISGRFCDWTGSRGLHLLVSEPGYAINGKVSEIQAPIAYTTIENVVLVKRLEQIGSLPLLTHISLFNGNEEILPPPSVGGERLMETGRQAYLTYVLKPIMREARPRDIRTVCDFWEYFRNSCLVLPPDREVEFVIETQTDSAPVSISPYSRSPKELKELKTQLQELLDRGFIRLSTSTWGTPRLRKCVEFEGSDARQQAFEKLKEALTNAPVLIQPVSERELYMRQRRWLELLKDYDLRLSTIRRAPVCWAETRQKLSPLVDILKGTTEKVKLICDQLKIASDRQKSYADLKRREIEYAVGDRVFLKVSLWKKVMRVERIHDVFHVSMHRRYRSDLSHVMPVEEIELYTDMSYDEEPVEILTSDGKVLRGKTIELVKCWRLRYCEDRLSGVARARVGEWKCFYMVEQRFDDVWGLRLGLIASLGEGKEARRIHLGLCSSTVFGNYGSMTKQWGGLPYLGAC
ncbi:hypothetical protein GQ457_14G019390 [Hibiscus cannabinus]